MKLRNHMIAVLAVSALAAPLAFATDSQPQAGSDDYVAPPPPPLRGDITNDGKVDIHDLQAVIDAWGEKKRARHQADIFPDRGDGKVDGMDLMTVLADWGM